RYGVLAVRERVPAPRPRPAPEGAPGAVRHPGPRDQDRGHLPRVHDPGHGDEPDPLLHLLGRGEVSAMPAGRRDDEPPPNLSGDWQLDAQPADAEQGADAPRPPQSDPPA